MGRSRSAALLAAIAVLVPGAAALAQDAPANAPAPPATAAPTDTAAPPASASASTSASAPAPASTGAVTGYGYGDTPHAKAPPPVQHHAGKLKHHANEVVAMQPGFEMLADGGSRLFVQLSKYVDVDQAKGAAPKAARKAKHANAKGKKSAAAEVNPSSSSSLVVTMKGAEVVRRVNELALVTVHFNTPVVRARLVPAGSNLKFEIELRADVTPKVQVVPTKDNGAMLQIDFPAGSYLPANESASLVPQAPETVPSDGVGDSTSSTDME